MITEDFVVDRLILLLHSNDKYSRTEFSFNFTM